MLEPHERQLLLESLRPPEGYEIDRAIGTTYSLDLVTLLTTPLAFTFFDWRSEDGRPDADPLLLLEAIRRHAERITIFCQAGQIKIPPADQKLIPYLEGSVIEVQPPAPGGVFHPKVWILRFKAPASPIRYRVLCLSRNLTFDRSWDTILTLEGDLKDRRNAYGRNHPLADFVAALSGIAVRPVAGELRQTIEKIAAEIRMVDFETLEGFDDFRFFALGIGARGRAWPFDGDIRRMLVISPFVSSRLLERLTGQGKGHCLVSRPEELDALSPECLSRFEQVHRLSEGAQSEETDDRPADSGLHAKVFVADAGWSSRVWVGSANATNAAFSRNVEFMVELSGKKSVCGIDAILQGHDGRSGLASLLEMYRPPDVPVEKPENVRRLEERIKAAVRAIGSMRLQAHVATTAQGLFDVRVAPGESEAPPPELQGVSIRLWPVTLGEAHAVALDFADPAGACFRGLSFEALISFFAFRVEASEEGQSLTRTFVLNLELIGAPANRRERILRSMLSNREQLLRLILLILAAAEGDAAGMMEILAGHDGGDPSRDRPFVPARLFEALVRTLGRCPERLDEIARLMADLRADPESANVVPEEFDAIWQPIWQARQALVPEADRGAR